MDELKNFSQSDLSFLVDAVTKDVLPIENLTRNYYFMATKYALSGIDKSVLNPSQSDMGKMQKRIRAKAQKNSLNPNIFMSPDVYSYNKYTEKWVGDVIDNFGTIQDPDSAVEFRNWFNVNAYNGGHPFEIYPNVCLYVRQKKDKFCLELADFDVFVGVPSERVLKMFLATRQNNIPVALQDKNSFLEKIKKYNLLNR